jgi:hypothetical protein
MRHSAPPGKHDLDAFYRAAPRRFLIRVKREEHGFDRVGPVEGGLQVPASHSRGGVGRMVGVSVHLPPHRSLIPWIGRAIPRRRERHQRAAIRRLFPPRSRLGTKATERRTAADQSKSTCNIMSRCRDQNTTLTKLALAARTDVAFKFKYGAKVDTLPPAAVAGLMEFRKYLAEA